MKTMYEFKANAGLPYLVCFSGANAEEALKAARERYPNAELFTRANPPVIRTAYRRDGREFNVRVYANGRTADLD